MLVADTSGLLSLFNADEPLHAKVAAEVEGEREPLVVSPFVLAELDYLVARELGVDAEIEVLREMAGGAYHLADFPASDVLKAEAIVARYRDQQVGLTDASLVVLAEAMKTKRILTLDRRHFEVIRPLSGGRFKIVP